MTQHIFGPPRSMIDLGDSSVPYWRIGQGPDLVFIHGWPLDGRTWRASVDRLKDQFTCHIIDLPRTGLSKWSETTRIGVNAYGDVVYDAVQQMNIEGDTFGFVGQNTGGSYLRLAAARMPERISGIVLGNTEIPHRHSPHLRFLFTIGKLKSLTTLLRLTMRLRIGRASLLMMAGAHRQHLHGDFTETFLRPLIEDDRLMEGAADTLRHVRVGDFNQLRYAHGKITAPIKLVGGVQDWWFRSRAAKKVLEEFAGKAEYVGVSPGRLMIHEEQAERFSDEIISHFKPRFDAETTSPEKRSV